MFDGLEIPLIIFDFARTGTLGPLWGSLLPLARMSAQQISIQEAGRSKATSKSKKSESESYGEYHWERVFENQLDAIFLCASFVTRNSNEIQSGGNAATKVFPGLIMLELERTRNGHTDENRVEKIRGLSLWISALAEEVIP